jgi:hypothetical protein
VQCPNIIIIIIIGTDAAQSVKRQGYGQHNLRFEYRLGQEISSTFQKVQTGTGAHPASFPLVTGFLSSGQDYWNK